MQYRYLDRSGLGVSTLTMAAMTFGGREKLGNTDQANGTHQIDVCLDHGINLLDTANIYADRLGPIDRNLLSPHIEESKRG